MSELTIFENQGLCIAFFSSNATFSTCFKQKLDTFSQILLSNFSLRRRGGGKGSAYPQ